MKSLTIFLLASLILTSACSTSINNFEKCLPSEFEVNLKSLVSSFDGFLERSHHGDMEHFISAVIHRDMPAISEFKDLDFDLAEKLRLGDFENHIYSEYDEKLEEGYISPPRTAGDNPSTIRKLFKIDIDKPFLNCVTKASTEGDLITEYVQLHTKYSDLSPLVFGQLFLDNQNDPDYNTQLAKAIIAVEMYYVILEVVNKSKRD